MRSRDELEIMASMKNGNAFVTRGMLDVNQKTDAIYMLHMAGDRRSAPLSSARLLLPLGARPSIRFSLVISFSFIKVPTGSGVTATRGVLALVFPRTERLFRGIFFSFAQSARAELMYHFGQRVIESPPLVFFNPVWKL